MKGLYLKVKNSQRLEDRINDNEGGDSTTVYKEVECDDPGKMMFDEMMKDIYEVYSSESAYAITLEDCEMDCPIHGATSWAGFSYQDRVGDNRFDTACVSIWYAFLKLE